MSASRDVLVDNSLPSGASPAERIAFGRARRKQVTRSALAEVSPEAGRSDPLGLLELQARDRVPELVPIRYGRMAASTFAYLRGAALVMTDDLSHAPDSGLIAPLCGDAHLSNFGLYATPERAQAFDLNDFDETHPGPFEWDVKRLAASFLVASRGNGFSDTRARATALAAAESYRSAIRESARSGNLENWYRNIDIDAALAVIRDRLDTSREKNTRKALAKARNRNSAQALSKLTVVVDGKARIRSDPPLLVPVEQVFPGGYGDEVYTEIRRRLEDYRQTLQPHLRRLFDSYELVQVARKVVGVGSVGTRTWIALFTGAGDNDPLFLQIKEAPPSVLSNYVPGYTFDNQGERVVNGQRLLQASSDIFLGWQSGPGPGGIERDFYVRQLRDGKGSVVIEAMAPDAMRLYAELCGRTLAHAHARSGDRFAIAGYLGAKPVFDEAIADFAVSYADRTERDHAQLVAAIAGGTVGAEQL